MQSPALVIDLDVDVSPDESRKFVRFEMADISPFLDIRFPRGDGTDAM
jgi:hypothetical protein